MKRILSLISIILILFLAFSAVHAADNETAGSDKTFEAIQKTIDSTEENGTILLDGTYSGSGNPIVINKALTIKSSGGAVKLNANSKSQIFKIKADNVVLDNLEIVNGVLYEPSGITYGGAINAEGNNLKILNCNFKTSSARYGGALYCSGNNVSIANCQFSKNTAEYSGGAFELDGNDNSIDNCIFTDNIAYHVGADIAVVGNNAIITNCWFNSISDRSKASQFGGAVVWMGKNGKLSKSSFNGYYAKKFGSAIYWKGDNGTLNYCEFSNNTSPNDLAYFGNPDYADYNYWGMNINSREEFISQKLVYFDGEFKAPANWINPMIITCKNLVTHNTVNAKNGKYFKVTLKDFNGNPLNSLEVIIKFNGNSYKRTTDEKGIASVQANIKNPGKYNVEVIFDGDDRFKSASASAKITVNKQKPTLTVATKSLKLKTKNKVVKIYLKDQFKKAISKKTVKITINKKTYSTKTNSKGLASFKVTLKTKKNYSCTVKFAGDKYYSSAKKSAKIRVK